MIATPLPPTAAVPRRRQAAGHSSSQGVFLCRSSLLACWGSAFPAQSTARKALLLQHVWLLKVPGVICVVVPVRTHSADFCDEQGTWLELSGNCQIGDLKTGAELVRFSSASCVPRPLWGYPRLLSRWSRGIREQPDRTSSKPTNCSLPFPRGNQGTRPTWGHVGGIARRHECRSGCAEAVLPTV